jgi:hypothetical protein
LDNDTFDIGGNENKKKDTNEKKIEETGDPSSEELEEWETAKVSGFTSYNDWKDAKKGGFTTYDNWVQAKNEGFDKKSEWDDWQEIKSSGLTDIGLFQETMKINFMQNNLRKMFLIQLKLAKKGGFDSYRTWKEAQKWKIDDYSEWQLVKDFNLQSMEEYALVKEFQKKINLLLDELYPNQSLSFERIKEINAEDYNYNQIKTPPNSIVYKDFTKERFEDLLEKTIKFLILNSDIYKYSRLTHSILKIPSMQISYQENSTKPNIASKIQCSNCQNLIPKINDFCQYCGFKVIKCPICQSPLVNAIGICINCKTQFHKHHLLEVVKVSGQCPICKTELKDYQIQNLED